MTVSTSPIRPSLVRGRGPTAARPTTTVGSLGRRLLAWATGASVPVGGEVRSPIDKPFPFFGE